MVDVALHIQHRRPAGVRHAVDVVVADAPVALADGDAVIVAPKDFTDLLAGVAMADLCCLVVDECRVPPQLGHAGLEAGARACAGEEEEHGQRLVA